MENDQVNWESDLLNGFFREESVVLLVLENQRNNKKTMKGDSLQDNEDQVSAAIFQLMGLISQKYGVAAVGQFESVI